MKLARCKMLSIIGMMVMVLGIAVTPVHADDEKSKAKYSRTAMLPDFEKFMVLISSSPVTTVDGTFAVDGMIAGDGMHFHKDVMGRNDQEVEEHKMSAVNYFADRFGLDAMDAGRVYFTGFEVMPEMNYRVVISSGDKVPATGWSVADGGWVAVVIDPAGYSLSDGQVVPPGTMFAYGDYLISKSGHGGAGHDDDEDDNFMQISYRSQNPIFVNPNGSFGVSCELFNDALGTGVGSGQTLPVLLPNGQIAFNTRLVATFSAWGKSVDAVITAQ